MKKNLRFLMVTTFYPPYNFGGDGLFVHRLSNELARRGHSVDVIHCLDAYRLLAGRNPVKTYEDHENITVHGLKSPWGFLSPLATQQTGWPLFKSARIRKIMAKGFDIIQYHNISLVGGPRVLEYGDGLKIYYLHEYWLVCPTHVLFKFNRHFCQKRHCLACSLIYKRPPQWWRYNNFLQKAVEHVDAFIAPSLFIAEKHRQMGLNVPFHHLPYFIPQQGGGGAHRGKYPDKNSRKPYFLFVGRLEKLKGLQTLIPLFRRYDKAELLVAGRGNYEAALRNLAEGCRRIRFLGHLSPQKLQSLYEGAVALIVPSLCYEAFPLVMIEAFKARTPVLARNLGGMTELIDESGGGQVFDGQEALESAMDRLLTDKQYRIKLGEFGYQAYRRKWTPEAHLQGLFALIREKSLRAK